MLARGFTVICLVVALLGMLAAAFVAEASRPQSTAYTGEIVPCILEPWCSR